MNVRVRVRVVIRMYSLKLGMNDNDAFAASGGLVCGDVLRLEGVERLTCRIPLAPSH